MFFIETERLKLIPLTHQLLQLSHTNRAVMERVLGLNVSSMQIEEPFVSEYNDAMINFWLPKTLAHPDKYQWHTNWEIILKSANIAIGGIGLGGEPNENGETETGYMIDRQHQGKGYASEALKALIQWTFTRHSVTCMIAHTYNDNAASKKVLIKNGFTQVAGQSGLLTFRLAKRLSLH